MPDIAARHLPVSEEDLRFQRRLWRVERAFWWVQLAIVLAALAGLAGTGPLADGHAERGGLAVAYERIARNGRPGTVALTFSPALVREGEVRLRLDRRWLSGVSIDGILPEPARSEAGDQGTRFTFRVAPGGVARVRLRFQYEATGWRRCRLQVEGGPALSFSQWVYP
jgi:hypothetical protein